MKKHDGHKHEELIRVVFVHRGIASPLYIPKGLKASQALVGGLIERVMDFAYPRNSAGTGPEIDIFANEEAYLIDPEGESVEEPVTGCQILGPYFYVGHDGQGNGISLTDQQVAYILGAHSAMS
jgi:hypothetical protein